MNDDTLTGNIGEWSEFYTFIKILSERVLIPADADLNPEFENALPVLKILREEIPNDIKTFDLISDSSKILIYSGSDTNPKIVNSELVSTKLSTIFSKMASGVSRDSERDGLMATLSCKVFGAKPAGSKEDITLVIHDPMTAQNREMSYSIKSQVGSPSTLLNASNATNFIFEILPDINVSELENINKQGSARKIIKKLQDSKKSLKFLSTQNMNFNENMEKIDYLFPEIMSYLLNMHYSTKLSKISEIFNSLNDTFLLPNSNKLVKKIDVEYKIKTFLAAIALGMTPSRAWDGKLSANGGYLILKTDGTLVCYHIFNLDSFKDFLFNSTKFERGSETRHHYGKIYSESDRFFINLNLQIRFTK